MMAPDAITQERIYLALKRDLLGYTYRAGTRLDLQGIADRHRASTTPVREALYRLRGERLIEPHVDGGFQIALPDAGELLHLYVWNAQHLLAALHITRGAALIRALGEAQPIGLSKVLSTQANAAAGIFAAIGRATGNGAFLDHIERVNERLHFPRIAEGHYFGDLSREIRTLAKVDDPNVLTITRRRILAFHRRRIEHVAQIASILHAQRLG